MVHGSCFMVLVIFLFLVHTEWGKRVSFPCYPGHISVSRRQNQRSVLYVSLLIMPICHMVSYYKTVNCQHDMPQNCSAANNKHNKKIHILHLVTVSTVCKCQGVGTSVSPQVRQTSVPVRFGKTLRAVDVA